MKPVVFVVGNIEAGPIVDMFMEEGWFIGETLRGADLVQFTGGHDVSPGLYKERAHPLTHCWPARDAFERICYNLAKDAGIPMAGICRGGQFLNVMNGGKLWQDVDGHTLTGMHWANCHVKNDRIPVTSVHHQMMRPGKGAEVLMTARATTKKERTSKHGHVTTVINDKEPDIEAVYYMKTGSLCYQPHPEYHMENIEKCRERYFEYIWKCFYLQGKED